MSLNGFINFLKPPGMTSHDVVASLRRLFNQKSIGHLGTLDPGAGGCLPIAIGNATKLIRYITEKNKSYRAEMLFGMESNTGDLFGEISDWANPRIPDLSRLNEIIESFKGEIEQVPPMASSIKVGGKKLYEYFRKGIDVEIPKRKVSIFSLDVMDYNYPRLIVDVSCSEGTYIRTLCQDIGAKAGCGAVMSFLVRTESAGFKIENSITYDEISDYYSNGDDFIVTPYEMLSNYPEFELDLMLSRKVRYGNSFDVDLDLLDNSVVKLIDNEGIFIAIGRYIKGKISPERVFLN